MLTGAVLAGGRSRRFGKNKALEVFRDMRLIDHAVESLHNICNPLLLVANDLSLYYDVQATLVQDVIPHQGPLGAIYTSLLFSPHEWVFVKATDMPFLTPEIVMMMLGLRAESDVVVPLYGNMYEPLLALYHRRCLPMIASALSSQERKVVAFYPKVRIKTLDEQEWRQVDKEGRSFFNINTLEDWESLQWS